MVYITNPLPWMSISKILLYDSHFHLCHWMLCDSGGEEVKLSISCPLLFLENWGSVYICETAASRKSTLCQAAVLLHSEGDGSKGQSRWWFQRNIQLELSVSEEGIGCWWKWGSCRAHEQRPCLYFFIIIILICWPPFLMT